MLTKQQQSSIVQCPIKVGIKENKLGERFSILRVDLGAVKGF